MFKFMRDPTALTNVLRGSLKFARISELNDPSELVPPIDRQELRRSLNELRSKGLSEQDLQQLQRQAALMARVAPHHQSVPAPATVQQAEMMLRSPVYDNFDYMERRLEEFAAAVAARVGVLCLSSRFDSLPMWAHYADNAAGYVVEFKDLDLAFPGDGTGIPNELLDIRYERHQRGMTFDPATCDALFLAKFQDWSYEQERRVIRPLDECRQQGGLFLHDVAPRHVQSVIIGWRMSSADARAIQDDVASLNPEVRVRRATISRGCVEILN